MKKYVRVMYNTKSHDGDFEYKINKINETDNWNPNADNPKDFGGFNFSTEDKILRWLLRGENIISWRTEACEILKQLGFDGVVYVPEYSTWKPKEDYVDQAMWKRLALINARVILFWIPRKLPDMAAFTTNVEFGYWLHIIWQTVKRNITFRKAKCYKKIKEVKKMNNDNRQNSTINWLITIYLTLLKNSLFIKLCWH